jgi:hypothetical protein
VKTSLKSTISILGASPRKVTVVRLVQDAGDAIRNRDARQAGAVSEGSYPPMLVTLSGIVMLVRLVQLSEGVFPRCW